MNNLNKSRQEIVEDLVKALNSTDKPAAWLKSAITNELTKKTRRGRPKGGITAVRGSSYIRAKEVMCIECEGVSRNVAIKTVSDKWKLPNNTIQKDLSRYESKVFFDQGEAAKAAEKHYLHRALNSFTYNYLNLKFKYKTDNEIKQAADDLAYEFMSKVISAQVEAYGMQQEYDKIGVKVNDIFFEDASHRSQLVAIGLSFFEAMERALYDSLRHEDK